MTPDAVYDEYRRVLSEECRRLPSEWRFKSNPAYRVILEHVSEPQGQHYSRLIQTEFHELCSRRAQLLRSIVADNDRYGDPVKVLCSGMFTSCSPTNMRYLFHALLILQHMKKLSINSVRIVEVGGGYGGLAVYLYRLAELFSVRILEYRIFDLPEALVLQHEYTKALGVPIETTNCLDEISVYSSDGNIPSYFISNYAFSELSRPIREWYETAVIPHCEHGFLAWNFFPVYPFTAKPMTIEAERPETAPTNRFVRF